MLSCHIKPNFIILKIFSHLLRCRSDNSVNKSQTKHSDYQLNLPAIWLTCWTGSNYKTCFNSNVVSIHISVHLRTSETWYEQTETNSFVWSAGLRDYLKGKKLHNTLFIGSSMDDCNHFLPYCSAYPYLLLSFLHWKILVSRRRQILPREAVVTSLNYFIFISKDLVIICSHDFTQLHHRELSEFLAEMSPLTVLKPVPARGSLSHQKA